MELFAKLFSSLLVFVYHCFDRIVIHGYLNGQSRPEQVVYFFREVLGHPVVSKEALSQRTDDYRNWVEAYARTTRSPSSGPRRVFAKRITCYPLYAAWRSAMPSACTSFSRAWNREGRSAFACPSSPPRTPTTVSSPANGAASHTTTSTS